MLNYFWEKGRLKQQHTSRWKCTIVNKPAGVIAVFRNISVGPLSLLCIQQYGVYDVFIMNRAVYIHLFDFFSKVWNISVMKNVCFFVTMSILLGYCEASRNVTTDWDKRHTDGTSGQKEIQLLFQY